MSEDKEKGWPIYSQKNLCIGYVSHEAAIYLKLAVD